MARTCASIYRAVEAAIEGVFRACDPPHTLAAAVHPTPPTVSIRIVRVLVSRTMLPLGAPPLPCGPLTGSVAHVDFGHAKTPRRALRGRK